MTTKNATRKARKNTISEVPFVSPTTRLANGDHSWTSPNGLTILRPRNASYVVLLRGNDEIATLTIEEANERGYEVYSKSTDDTERMWGRILCSAATLNYPRTR